MGKAVGTKEKITTTFLKLYSKKPLENIKVTDICEACDISRGTFYYHYTDVVAICEEIEDGLVREMEEGLTTTMMFSVVNQLDPSNLDNFINAYMATLQDYKKKKTIYRCLMNGSHGKQFVNKWIMSVRRKNDFNFSYINLSTEHQEWMGTFLAAGLVNMLARWIDRNCEDDPRIIAETFANVLFKGSIVSKK